QSDVARWMQPPHRAAVKHNPAALRHRFAFPSVFACRVFPCCCEAFMRIAVIHIGQETNDFNKLPTTLARFAAFGLYERGEVLRQMRGLGQVGGCIDAVADSGLAVEWVPIISGWALAGGRL